MIVEIKMHIVNHKNRLKYTDVVIRDLSVWTWGMIMDWDSYNGQLWKTLQEYSMEKS